MNNFPTVIEHAVGDSNALAISEKERATLINALRPVAELMAQAQTLAKCEVNDQNTAAHAANVLARLRAGSEQWEKTLREFRSGYISMLFAVHRRWTGLIALKDFLDSEARKLKGKIILWQESERRKAEEHQRKLQAEADARAEVERRRLEAKAEKLKTPEKKEALLEQAASIVAPVITVAPPAKAVNVQRRWKVKSIDLDAMGIPKQVQGFVEIKINALERSKAANSMLDVPGVEFHQVVV